MAEFIDSIQTQEDVRSVLRRLRIETLDLLSAAEVNVFKSPRTAAQSLAIIQLRSLKESTENTMAAMLWLSD